MDKVFVKKPELLEVLRTNRAKHEEEYKEAHKNYLEEVYTTLKRSLENLDGKEDPELSKLTMLIRPKNYLQEYDRAIKMIEMTTQDEITLTEDDFDKLVLDNWQWKDNFTAMNSFYNSKMK